MHPDYDTKSAWRAIFDSLSEHAHSQQRAEDMTNAVYYALLGAGLLKKRGTDQ